MPREDLQKIVPNAAQKPLQAAIWGRVANR